MTYLASDEPRKDVHDGRCGGGRIACCCGVELQQRKDGESEGERRVVRTAVEEETQRSAGAARVGEGDM